MEMGSAGPACAGSPEGGAILVPSFGKTTLMRSLMRKRFACPACRATGPEGWPGCRRQSSPDYRSKLHLEAAINPEPDKIRTINADSCNPSTTGSGAKARFHDTGASDRAIKNAPENLRGVAGASSPTGPAMHADVRGRGASEQRAQRLAMSGTSRLCEPLNSWRGRPILYSGSVIISSHCEIQPGVRASAKMQVNSEVGMPRARCTIPE
ncbi:hypothetical protein DFLDMN_001432 [Cupriavidus sp. H19C3]